MKSLHPCLFGAALAVLAGCTTVGPDYHLPAQAAINRPGARQPFIDTAGVAALDATHAAVNPWWQLYDDPLLDRLVQQALANNAGLRAATGNLARATAIFDEAEAAGEFDFGANANVQRAEIAAESLLQTEKLPVFNIGQAGLTASYEFDLFGKLKRATEAAQADAQAVQSALDLARITVVAQVARDYVTTCHVNRQLGIAQHSLELQQRSAQVAQRLFDAGRGTRTDVTRAKAQVSLLNAALPPLRARKKSAEYALAALLGGTPGELPDGVAECLEPPTLKQPIPIGDGMALLQRRPDVREAERELAAATAKIGVVTADLYPNVSLGASLGAYGLLGDLGTAPTRTWAVGPLISWSIPGRGAHARVRLAEAGAQVALAQFDQTVLDALRDTQTALNAYAQQLDRQSALHQAADQARQAAEENGQLYRGGRSPYLTSLDADRTLASAQAQAADADAQVSLDQVALFLALGGGWQSAASAPPDGAATAPHPAAH